MARGFESKAVTDQQESVQDRRARARRGRTEVDPALVARRRQLELARVDIERRLRVAVVPAHRQMLERALHALEIDRTALD